MKSFISDFEKDLPHLFNVSSYFGNLRTEFLGRYFQYRLETTSTMNDIKKEMEMGSFSGTTVLAERQTHGRGQTRGDKPKEVRKWSSQYKGNLYFSFLLRTDVENINKVILSLPIAIVQGLKKVGISSARIKWPNDVFVDGKKICGMLVLSEMSGSTCSMNIGIGINVYESMQKNEEVKNIATSCADILGENRCVPGIREQILSTLFNTLEICLLGEMETVSNLFRDYNIFSKGEKIIIMPGKKENESDYYVANYIGIDEMGSLMVEKQDGLVIKLRSGEVSVRKKGK